jgi:nitrogen fixation protein FixH
VTAAPSERRSRWIPWTFVAMFGVIVAVNGIMVMSALDTWSGLATNDPYHHGLKYNRKIAEVERERKLGWQLASGFHATAPGRGELRLRAFDRNGRPIMGAKVVAKVVRPVTFGLDFTVALAGRGAGLYAAAVRFPKRGLWEVRYHIAGNGERVTAVRRIEVK